MVTPPYFPDALARGHQIAVVAQHVILIADGHELP